MGVLLYCHNIDDMLQLTAEAIDSLIGILFVKGGVVALSTEWHVFQPLWIVLFSLAWVVFLQFLSLLNVSNPSRVLGLCHALLSVAMGIPVLLMLTTPSAGYPSMYESLHFNKIPLAITCNMMCYASVGYFLMDSYFLVRRAYLKHHIGAIVTWLCSAYHHSGSLVHGVSLICLFEMGAILVQLSRVLPKNLLSRTFVCVGYTCTRICITWYYGFAAYYNIALLSEGTIFTTITDIGIWTGLLFLLVLNVKWTLMQWKALIMSIPYFSKTKAEDQKDFFTYHQEIIGNTNRPSRLLKVE